MKETTQLIIAGIMIVLFMFAMVTVFERNECNAFIEKQEYLQVSLERADWFQAQCDAHNINIIVK